jgi:hypothetical protein
MGLYGLAAKGETKTHPHLTAKTGALRLKILLEDPLQIF